jgi:hypothetical protein
MKVARETRRTPADDELNRALAVLERSDADEAAVDKAFETLVSSLAAPVPSGDFARRVTLAVRRAPLGEGRRPLARPLADWSRVAALAAAAAAVAWGVVAGIGPFGAYTLARIVEFFVRAGLSVLVSLSTALRVWDAVLTVAAALTESLASPAVGLALTATAMVSGLSLIALVRLLSTEQESAPWHDRSSPV